MNTSNLLGECIGINSALEVKAVSVDLLCPGESLIQYHAYMVKSKATAININNIK